MGLKVNLLYCQENGFHAVFIKKKNNVSFPQIFRTFFLYIVVILLLLCVCFPLILKIKYNQKQD